ncbi:MAG: hypothetical protein AAF790_03720, partial [Planctomycetota bacterium]
FSLDFDADIADADATTNMGYETTTSNVSGAVTFQNGLLSSVTASADINFAYDYTVRGGTILDFPGTFAIESNVWTLDVDATVAVVRHAWDVTGIVLVPGDYDQNGFVEAADLAAWQRDFGSAGGDADGNLDGVVNGADYAIWRNNLTAPAAAVGAAASVSAPEPSAAALLFSHAWLAAGRRRPRTAAGG